MSRLVEAARRYKGTRFRHRGRSSSFVDCAGLGWRIYHDCGVDLPDFRLYGPEPHNDGLVQHMTVAFGAPVHVAPVRFCDLQLGDVVVMRFQTEPHHVGMIADYVKPGHLSLIDADGMEGKVVERRLSEKYLARITHVFRKPV
jgi:cell wall-associated NlpC family hydrolase